MYILDTDTLIYFLNGKDSVVQHITELPSDMLYTTIINHSELLFGAFKSTNKKRNLSKIRDFLQNIKILPFCINASEIFAEEKAILKKNGNMIADMDLMIASIAIYNNMVLITNNTKHFVRIKNLKMENWLN